MLFGGTQDMALYFSPDLAPVSPWHPVPSLVGLFCGMIVIVSAGSNIVWGWQLRRAEATREQRLARKVAFVSGIGMIADWISGYYGFGSLVALLTGIWLMKKHTKMDK